MKLFYKLLLLLLTIVPSGAYAQQSGTILEGKIKVAVIEFTPTRPEDQKPGQDYVFDYHVVKYLSLTTEQVDEIKSLVNKGAIFDAQNAKSCLFQPGFAIIGSTKTKWFPLYLKTRGEVIVSTGQCGKSIIIKDGNEQYRDLGQNNTLEELLNSLK